jgi:hypothetical protein
MVTSYEGYLWNTRTGILTVLQLLICFSETNCDKRTVCQSHHICPLTQLAAPYFEYTSWVKRTFNSAYLPRYWFTFVNLYGHCTDNTRTYDGTGYWTTVASRAVVRRTLISSQRDFINGRLVAASTFGTTRIAIDKENTLKTQTPNILLQTFI